MYINSCGKTLNVGVIMRVARWVGDMLRMFGLGEGPRLEGEIGWGQDRSSSLDTVAVSAMINYILRDPGLKNSRPG